ncbi:MAG: hypothetical protein DRO15_00225 [Thermoprotei archaeon]|nr:MAG: hypothetical protein DRO15_00225 [Thermoprotei archaeon]
MGAELTTIVLSVICAYLGVLTVIGYIGYRKTKPTPEDYFLASRTLGLFVLSMTMIATYASMWTFLGAVGGNYRIGLSFLSMMMMWNLLWPITLWLFGPRVWLLGRAYKYITYSELINDYYESRFLGVIAAAVGILALIPYIAVQLIGGGLALEAFTKGGIPYAVGVTLMFVIMVIYVLIGGLRSVVWTDVIQGVFFLSAMFGMAMYAVYLLGGFGNMFSSIASTTPKLLKPGAIGFGMWIGYVFTWGIAVLLPHMFQRMLMAKSPRTIGRTAASLSILSGWIQTVPVFILGIACTLLIPGLTGKATDAATALFAGKFLDPWLGAAIIAAAFAAGMSTLDSQLLTASSILVRDGYVNPFNKKLPPEKETLLGRLVIIGLGIIIEIFALMRPGLIVPISTAGTAICISSYLYPLIGATLWRRAGKLAAYGSIISAAVTAIVTWLVLPFPLGIYNVLWGLIIGGIVFIILSLIGKPPSPEKQEKFHGLLSKVFSY